MKAHLMLIIVLISALSILGCGSEEDSTPTEIAPSPPPVYSSIHTEELISDPDFDLSSTSELQVSLPRSPSSSVGYFINVCTDYSNNKTDVKDTDAIYINYASCKLRTKLALTPQQFTVYISAAEQKLIAQIWPMENGAKPINIYWNIADSGKNWQVTF